MSGIASMALPGSIPTYVIGKGRINPNELFSSGDEKSEYSRILNGRKGDDIAPDVKIKKVCVADLFYMSNNFQS